MGSTPDLSRLTVDLERSTLFLLLPFTLPNGGGAAPSPPDGWELVEPPKKDLVPAIASLFPNKEDPRQGPDSSHSRKPSANHRLIHYRWWRRPFPEAADATVDGIRTKLVEVQFFLGNAGAGVMVCELKPVGEAARRPATWTELARKAGQESPGAANADSATSGPPTTISPEFDVRRLLEELAGELPVEPMLDRRPVAFTILFVETPGDPDEDAHRLARYFLRRVPFETDLRSNVETDNLFMLHDHADTWLFASLRSIGCVSANVPKNNTFLADKYPKELRTQYLAAALLTLTFRRSLQRLAEDTVHAWGRSDRRKHSLFEQLHGDLATLSAGGGLTQVMESTSQDRWHQLLVSTFRLPEYHLEVSANLAGLHHSLQSDAAMQLNRKVMGFGILIGIPSLVLGFLSLSIPEVTTPGGVSLPAVLLTLLSSLIVGTAVWWFIAQRST